MPKYVTLEELLEKSDIIRPANVVKDKNNCCGDWVPIFEAAAKEKRDNDRKMSR